MKRSSVLLLTLFLLLCAGCSHTFTVPEDGTKLPYSALNADESGQFYLKLDDDCRMVEYKYFSIDRSGLETLRLYVRQNSPAYALWQSPEYTGKDPKYCHELACIASAELLPPALLGGKKDVRLLAAWCQRKYASTQFRIRNYSAKPVLYLDQYDAVEYSFETTIYDQEMFVHGVTCFLPDQPGTVIDFCFRLKTGAAKDIRRYREMGERFLRSVRFN